MSSLAFLVLRSARNSLLEVFRKPAKLAVWLLAIVGIVGLFALSLFTRQDRGTYLDLVWLKGAFSLLLVVFMVLSVQKGLASGDVIFDMNDVNMLFVSPVNPRSILLYGIVRMAKMAFLAGFFILFQGNSIGMWFPVDFGAIFLILLGFILAVCLLQIISLLIYILTNGRPRRKLLVRILTVAVFLPLAVSIGVGLLQSGDLLGTLENALRSPLFTWLPIAGWAAEGTVALIAGNIGSGLLFLGIVVAAGGLLIAYIALSNPDYYEDVLVATETAFEKKRVIAQGQVNAEAGSQRSVKVVKTGVGGFGASAIFYKHLRESFRTNRLGLWGLPSVVIFAGAVAFSLFMRGMQEGTFMLLQMLMWMQIFLIGTGRGLKETYSHYIYLIPASSFSKIVWSNLEIVFKVLVESIVLFSVCGAILGENPLIIALMVLVYTMFSLLLLGINYLSMRWTGANLSSGLLILIYVIAVIVIMVPGIVLAVVVGTATGEAGLELGLATLSAYELLAAFGCFALSTGVLHHCDMPVIRTTK